MREHSLTFQTTRIDDLSLVDGYNVPIAITNSADCSLANW